MNLVIEQIPEGHENALTLEELQFRTGFTSRYIRQQVCDSNELVINLQDGRGYFKPLPSEKELVRVWKMIMMSRIREIEARIVQAEEWGKNINDIPVDSNNDSQKEKVEL